MALNGIINSILCCANPIIPLCNNHYICGCNLAIFGSLVEVEKSLTCATNYLPQKKNTYTQPNNHRLCLDEHVNST